MTSQTSITNQAVLLLGEDGVQGLVEDSTEAGAAAEFYPDARNFVLADIKPPFAYKRAVPAGALPTPLGWFDYSYQLPIDCLLILEAGGETQHDRPKWSQEGGVLLATQPVGWIKYVRKGEDLEAYMDGPFAKALAAYLAHELAYAIMGSKDRSNELLDIYTARATAARNVYAFQNPSQEFYNQDLTMVR